MVLGGQPPGRVGRRRITFQGPSERAALRVSENGVAWSSEATESFCAHGAMRTSPALTAACQDTEIARWLPDGSVAVLGGRRARLSRAGSAELGARRRLQLRSRRRAGRLLGSIAMRLLRFSVGHIGYWMTRRGARSRDRDAALSRRSAGGPSTSSASVASSSSTDPDNHASQRVAEKAGFQREGIMRSALEYRDGSRRDSVIFSLLAGRARRRVAGRATPGRARAAAARARPSGGCVTNIAASPSSANGFTVYSGSVAGLARNSTNEPAASSLSSPSARPCGDSQSCGRGAIGGELAARREQQVGEGRRDRREDEEERALEPAGEPRHLDQEAGEHGHRRLDEHVAVRDVDELVGEDPVELGRRRSREQPRADRQRRAARAAARCKRARVAVAEEVELRPRDAGARREPLDGRLQKRRLGRDELTRADHSRRDAVEVPVQTGRREQDAEHSERRGPVAAGPPEERPHRCAASQKEEPGLRQVPRRGQEPHGASCRARPRRARAAASPARARRTGSCSAAKRCSGAGSGCGR